MKTKILFTIILFSLTAMLDAGCSTSSFTMGWVSSAGDNEMTASYATFSGTETGPMFSAEAGQTLTLEYTLSVEKGSALVSLKRLGGEIVWENEASEKNGEISEKLDITLPEAGQYQVSVEGIRTGGCYAISWLLD